MRDDSFQNLPKPPRDSPDDSALWADAVLVASLIALDPSGLNGAALKAHAGPVRDQWTAILGEQFPPTAVRRRLPISIGDDRLIGGLDIAATLSAGRPILQSGLLAEADGGLVLLPMAERADRLLISRISAALDAGHVRLERDGFSKCLPSRFALVAFDEDVEEHGSLLTTLSDRLAFRLDLRAVSWRAASVGGLDLDMAAARSHYAAFTPEPELFEKSTALAAMFGVSSLRAVGFLVRATLGLAALEGADRPDDEHLATAARLVIAPRATCMPAEEQDEAPASDHEDHQDEQQTSSHQMDEALDDRVVDAVRSVLQSGLLGQLSSSTARGSNGPGAGAGAEQQSQHRGRVIGAKRGELNGRGRLHLIETLRTAAPWQKMRRAQIQSGTPGRVVVRNDDIRIKRFKQRQESLTVFVVDASGSSAVNRLGEAKGAVEILLADCYSRRDQVALIAFRGEGAELLLPPTRALARAKKALSGLPGGGPTPLFAGIDAARALALAEGRSGRTVNLVFLTDGSANVGRNGPGRAEAHHDALDAAKALSCTKAPAIFIDTAPRPKPKGREIADAMGAIYLPLPFADAHVMAKTVRQVAA